MPTIEKRVRDPEDIKNSSVVALNRAVSTLAYSMKEVAKVSGRSALSASKMLAKPVSFAAREISSQYDTKKIASMSLSRINPILGLAMNSIIEKAGPSISASLSNFMAAAKQKLSDIRETRRERREARQYDESFSSTRRMSIGSTEGKGSGKRTMRVRGNRLVYTSYVKDHTSDDLPGAIDALRVSNAQWLKAVATKPKKDVENMPLPKAATGGYVTRSGRAIVHKGEAIVPGNLLVEQVDILKDILKTLRTGVSITTEKSTEMQRMSKEMKQRTESSERNESHTIKNLKTLFDRQHKIMDNRKRLYQLSAPRKFLRLMADPYSQEDVTFESRIAEQTERLADAMGIQHKKMSLSQRLHRYQDRMIRSMPLASFMRELTSTTSQFAKPLLKMGAAPVKAIFRKTGIDKLTEKEVKGDTWAEITAKSTAASYKVLKKFYLSAKEQLNLISEALTGKTVSTDDKNIWWLSRKLKKIPKFGSILSRGRNRGGGSPRRSMFSMAQDLGTSEVNMDSLSQKYNVPDRAEYEKPKWFPIAYVQEFFRILFHPAKTKAKEVGKSLKDKYIAPFTKTVSNLYHATLEFSVKVFKVFEEKRFWSTLKRKLIEGGGPIDKYIVQPIIKTYKFLAEAVSGVYKNIRSRISTFFSMVKKPPKIGRFAQRTIDFFHKHARQAPEKLISSLSSLQKTKDEKLKSEYDTYASGVSEKIVDENFEGEENPVVGQLKAIRSLCESVVALQRKQQNMSYDEIKANKNYQKRDQAISFKMWSLQKESNLMMKLRSVGNFFKEFIKWAPVVGGALFAFGGPKIRSFMTSLVTQLWKSGPLGKVLVSIGGLISTASALMLGLKAYMIGKAGVGLAAKGASLAHSAFMGIKAGGGVKTMISAAKAAQAAKTVGVAGTTVKAAGISSMAGPAASMALTGAAMAVVAAGGYAAGLTVYKKFIEPTLLAREKKAIDELTAISTLSEKKIQRLIAESKAADDILQQKGYSGIVDLVSKMKNNEFKVDTQGMSEDQLSGLRAAMESRVKAIEEMRVQQIATELKTKRTRFGWGNRDKKYRQGSEESEQVYLNRIEEAAREIFLSRQGQDRLYMDARQAQQALNARPLVLPDKKPTMQEHFQGVANDAYAQGEAYLKSAPMREARDTLRIASKDIAESVSESVEKVGNQMNRAAAEIAVGTSNALTNAATTVINNHTVGQHTQILRDSVEQITQRGIQ